MNYESSDNPGLHRFLCTNAAPNGYESTFFQLEIDSITSQISQLHKRLSELENQLRVYRGVLSPVRRMPAEVLGEIFVCFLPDMLQAGARNDLVNIQLVCKSWRDAARLTHQLWGSLYFEDVTNVPHKEVKQWLNRAGSLSKTLVLSPPYPSPHAACTNQTFACGPAQSSALATLLPNLEGTLDHLSLEYSGPKCFQRLLDLLEVVHEGPASLRRRTWHSLKSFRLEFEEEWNESPEALRSMFLQLPPNITSFELHLPSKWSDAFEHGEDSDRAPLPLPQGLLERLSSFTLFCDWDGTQWLEAALGHCVNVEILTLGFMGTCWVYEPDQPDTKRFLTSGLFLPKLRKLHLRQICLPSMDILRILKAPQLVELGIHYQSDEDDEDWAFSQAVLSLITRSGCVATLRLLHLRYTFLKPEELVATLGHLPFLTHLTLEDADSRSNSGYTFLLLAMSSQAQLLHLETLELLGLRPDYWFNPLFDFLMSRRPYRMENGEPVFVKPQGAFKLLRVAYQRTKKAKERFGESQVVQVLGKSGGISFDIGPILYID
jgi:hypothetical protein